MSGLDAWMHDLYHGDVIIDEERGYAYERRSNICEECGEVECICYFLECGEAEDIQAYYEEEHQKAKRKEADWLFHPVPVSSHYDSLDDIWTRSASSRSTDTANTAVASSSSSSAIPTANSTEVATPLPKSKPAAEVATTEKKASAATKVSFAPKATVKKAHKKLPLYLQMKQKRLSKNKK